MNYNLSYYVPITVYGYQIECMTFIFDFFDFGKRLIFDLQPNIQIKYDYKNFTNSKINSHNFYGIVA
jgi:hypothetical protein